MTTPVANNQAMLSNNIYTAFKTVEKTLPTTTVSLSKIRIQNTVPNLMESSVYMRDNMTLYQLMLTPKITNLILSDIYRDAVAGDLEEELSSYLEDDRSRYMTKSSNVYVKNYTLEGAYAHADFMKDTTLSVPSSRIKENRFYCYNPDLITNNIFEFIVDFTRPKAEYSALMLKLPTIVSGAMSEFVYLITTLFRKVKVIKHKKSMWMCDSFIVFASDPIPSNITNFKNLLGIELSKEVDSKKRITTFRLDQLSGDRFTHLLTDALPDDFVRQWNEFRTLIRDEIYRYHKLVKMSCDSNDVINQYQIFLKSVHSAKTQDIMAGRPGKYQHDLIVTFSEYLKLMHEENGPIMPIVYSPSQLDVEAIYNPLIALPMVTIRARGQVKLYLAEFKYLLRILPHLRNDRKKLIVYIGSAPGLHLVPLIKKFHNPSISWLLYDKAKFHSSLLDKNNQERYNITVINDYFTHETIKEFGSSTSIHRGSDVHFISDIRLATVDNDPSTEDLLRDYAIEDSLVMTLKPTTAYLKWRYPYLEEDQQLVMKRAGASRTEEWIQMYAKPVSSELRLFLEGPEYYIREIQTEEINKADRLMAAYKQLHRNYPRDIHPDQMVATSCRCNDCCLFNMLVIEAKKKGISLSADDVTSACGGSR